MKTFPILYKRTSTGKTQMWSIGVDKNVIIVDHGQVDGKIQHDEETIKSGKNAGRVNATTPEQQALAEATAKWEKKIKGGYVEDIARAQAGEKDIDGGYDCMLAHKFADHGHKIKYPAMTQPKLNGHRCLGVIKDGVATLWSRTRKPITSCPHIILELQQAFPGPGETLIDGELYNHDYKDNFEELASLIRQETPADNCIEVQYHVYDWAGTTLSFESRVGILASHIAAVQGSPLQYIKVTPTIKVDDEDAMLVAFNQFLTAGYEGSMARNCAGQYEGKRSYNLQKVKEFQDADWAITSIKEGRGSDAGCGIFQCRIAAAAHAAPCICKHCAFAVKMRGPKDRLREFLADPSLWQGKELVVKYQYISKYGIPIFPVGERFKE